jgi:hypothetical protein
MQFVRSSSDICRHNIDVTIYNSGNKLRPSNNKVISLIIVMLKYSQMIFTTGQIL